MITTIWLATTEGRPLRHLVLDYYAYSAESGSLESKFDEFHPEFIKILLLASLDIMNLGESSTDPTDQGCCYYHEHDQLYSKYGKPQQK